MGLLVLKDKIFDLYRSGIRSRGFHTNFSKILVGLLPSLFPLVAYANTAPSVSTPTSLVQFTEDTTGDMRLGFISLADLENDSLTLTATVTAGTINSVADGSAVGSGVTATLVSSTQFTLAGSITDLHDYMSGANRVSYTPPTNVNGNATELRLQVSDGSLTSPIEVEFIRIAAVNDAPVLDPSLTNYTQTINRDVGGSTAHDSENLGFSYYSAMRLDAVTDVDGIAKRSIAVTSVDNRYGKWQYSTSWIEYIRYVSYYPGGWRDFSSTTGEIVDLSTSSVRLGQALHPSYIRYVPNASVVGTASLTFRAWDESTGGTTGSTANTTTNGGTTPYSVATDSIYVRTTADPEVANLANDIARFVDGEESALLDVGSDATVIDADSTRLSRLYVYFSAGIVTGDELDIKTNTDVTLSSRLRGGEVSVDGTVIGTLYNDIPRNSSFVITLNSEATPARVQKLLRAISYRNTDTTTKVVTARTLVTELRDPDANTVTTTSYAQEAYGYQEGDVVASATLDETSIVVPTSADTIAEAVPILDFAVSDSGELDSLPLNITRIRLVLSGTMPYSERVKLKFLLSGPDITDRAGSWGSGSAADAGIYFSSLPISIANGSSETYTVKVYRNPTESMTDKSTVIVSVDGDDPYWTVNSTKSEMGTTSPVTNGSGFTVNAISTTLDFTTLPTTVTSGATFTAVVKAVDSGGSVDTDFAEQVTITTTSAGTLSGTTTVVAVNGIATFDNLSYTATTDGESFTLTANDQDGVDTDLIAKTSESVLSDVVADKLIFLRQPSPLRVVSGQNSNFTSTTYPIVAAVGAGNVIDTAYRSNAYNKSKHVYYTIIASSGSGILGKTNEDYSPYNGEDSFVNYVGTANGTTINWEYPTSGIIRFTNSSSVEGSTNTFYVRASSGTLTSADSDAMTSVVSERTATVTTASGISEPVSLSTLVTSSSTATPIFDFTLNDGGGETSDGLPLKVTNLLIQSDGTFSATDKSKVRLVLNGPDVTNAIASYNSTRQEWYFNRSIEVADGGSETYTISAYFASGAVISEGKTLRLYISTSRSPSVDYTGTRFGSFTTVDSGSSGSTLSVDATALQFSTQPSGSVSGTVFTTQPVVRAVDASGSIDTDFTETISISKKSGDGVFSGTLTVTAVAGVATFADLSYAATADGETFVLTANDQDAVGSDFAAIDSDSLTSDVVATKLVFATEPAPLTLVSAQSRTLTTAPIVRALDASDLLDTGYTDSVTLSENGAGSATISATGDIDANATTVTLAATAGVATFTDLSLNYTVSSAADETFSLRASSGALDAADSATFTAEVANADGSLIAASGVSEPQALDSTIDTVGEAINVFDFTLADGGGDDDLGISVTALNIHVAGTSNDSLRGQVTWRLNGSGVSAVVGAYDATNDLIAFSSLGIVLGSGASETYTLSAYYNDNSNLVDGATFAFSITGNSDLTYSGTSIASSTAVTATTPVQVVATALSFTTMPAGTRAGAAFGTQPVVKAVDAFGNVDRDFSETVTITESSAGTISGDSEVAAIAGVATFSGLSHRPLTDGEAITLVADDESDLTVGTFSDLPAVTANTITSNVVATKLVFLDEPAPLNLVKGRATDLTTVPRVGAVNDNGIIDVDQTGTVVLSEINGAGAVEMIVSGDSDGDPGGSKENASISLSRGVASFTAMNLKYTNAGDTNETFNLQATLTGLTSANSEQMRGVVADTDGDVTAAAVVREPVALDTSVGATDSAIALFDFTFSDGATVDSLPLEITALNINVSGTANDTVRSQIDWYLSGADATAVSGTYNADLDKITFSDLSISVASGESEVYTLSARYNDSTNITDGQTLLFSIDGDEDVTLSGTGTQFATTTAVTNGLGSTTEVTASRLVFSQQPAGSSSAVALLTQPIVQAQDAAGNRDNDFSEAVTLSTSAAGTLGGTLSVTATAGSAAFTDVSYTATVDKQSFTLIANDEDASGADLEVVSSSNVSSEVTASRLIFTVQPNPRAVTSGSAIEFSGGPRIAAVDAVGVVDIDITANVTLTEIDGAGSAVFGLATDTDRSPQRVRLPMVAGVAAFDNLQMTYSASGEAEENFYLNASAPSFASVSSESLASSPPAPPIDPTIRDKKDGTGKKITDPEIAKGGELSGGEVCGTAASEGVIRDVSLCAGSIVEGGEIAGEIAGDPENPAKIKGAIILPGTKLKNVRIGADVILLKGVVLGENVGFDSLLNVPAGVMLSDTLSKIAVPGSTAEDKRVALDLRSKPMPGAAESPRTSYLELVSETPEFADTGARLEQAVTGEVKMEFPSSEARLLPVSMRKTAVDDKGFFYDEDGNLSIRMGINLEIIMYPMFVDDKKVEEEIISYDSRYAIRYDKDSNFIITRDENEGAEASLARYIGRPGISAIKAVRRETPGFVFYPSPWLKNLQQVSIITENSKGDLLEQELVPVPKNWFELKGQLLAHSEVRYVRIDSTGVVTLGYRGEEFRLLAAYDVAPNVVFAKEDREIVFREAGDLNGDGEMDYYSFYANGDRQALYVFPR